VGSWVGDSDDVWKFVDECVDVQDLVVDGIRVEVRDAVWVPDVDLLSDVVKNDEGVGDVVPKVVPVQVIVALFVGTHVTPVVGVVSCVVVCVVVAVDNGVGDGDRIEFAVAVFEGDVVGVGLSAFVGSALSEHVSVGVWVQDIVLEHVADSVTATVGVMVSAAVREEGDDRVDVDVGEEDFWVAAVVDDVIVGDVVEVGDMV
jgi:hypothetical protein